jgi:hypothetical protein
MVLHRTHHRKYYKLCTEDFTGVYRCLALLHCVSCRVGAGQEGQQSLIQLKFAAIKDLMVSAGRSGAGHAPLLDIVMMFVY